jgi:hypothetical protein
MPHDPTTALLLVLFLAPWLICMWAMVMHIVTAALNEREHFSFGRLLIGSYLLERYNRRYFLAFLCAFAFAFSVVVVANVLLFKGVIDF